MTRRQKDLFPELSDGKKYVSDIPELMAEWHPTKNDDLMPEDVTHGSNKVAWWLCSEGHECVQPLIYVPFFNRVSGAGGFMFRAWWGRM